MQITLFALGVLVMMMVWRFMLRRTILDNSRDQLFDLRDELRETFIKNGWDIGSPIYKRLRDLLNGHLRFTEEVSVSQIVYLEVVVKHDKKLQSEFQIRAEKIFASDNEAQKEFIQSIRKRAMVAVMNFAVFSSGFLLLLSLLIAPIVTVGKVFRVIGRGLSSVGQVCVCSMRDIGRTTSIVMSSSAEIVAHHLFPSDFVESYSYRMGVA